MTVETAEEVVLDVPGGPPVDPDGPSDEAPYGWMTDAATGERRPKKRPGKRPRGAQPPVGKTPSLADLQTLGSLPGGTEDVAPGASKKVRGKRPLPELPPFRAGVIAKGVNRLYRRIGRVARMLDRNIGTAIIASTKKPAAAEDDEDQEDNLTVGEAWEAVAKNNPRIRRWLLRLIAGGAMSDLFEAHLPILLAILMVDGIRDRLPLARMAQAFFEDGDEDDEDGSGFMGGMGGMMAGLTPNDMAQMAGMFQQMMGQTAADIGRPPNSPRDPAADQGQA